MIRTKNSCPIHAKVYTTHKVLCDSVQSSENEQNNPSKLISDRWKTMYIMENICCKTQGDNGCKKMYTGGEDNNLSSRVRTGEKDSQVIYSLKELITKNVGINSRNIPHKEGKESIIHNDYM